jgi:hypothetical protein
MRETIRLLDGPQGGSDVTITGPDARYVRMGYVIWPDDLPVLKNSGRLYKVTHAKTSYKPWGATLSGWKYDRRI